jgi:hypothetical protein
MSRSFRTLTSAIAVAFALSLVSPPTAAHASNTWDALGLPITGTTSSESGTSVATSSDGSIVAIGSPEILLGSAGRVKIYQLSSGTWTQLGADIVGATNGDYTGFSVALSSDGLTVAVGSPRGEGARRFAGVGRIYRLQSGTWTQLGADIAGTALSGQLGYSVALSASGNRVALGAIGADNEGAVSVFDYTAGTNSWGQVGSTLDAEATFDEFGTSVSLSDDGVWLAVGAPKNDASSAANAGHARVFELVSTTWTQRGADIDGEVAGDLSGQSLALSANGQRLVIGSHRNDSGGVNAGRARVFDLTAGSWQLVGQALNGPAAGDDFGWAVDINAAGDQIAVGARTSGVPASEAGSVTAFTLVSGAWTQRGQTITGTAASEHAGYALALSSTGDRIVIGSPGRALPSVSTGEVRIFGFTATSPATVEPGPGRPGIYMHIAGPVGRPVLDSPIYVGSDRVAKSSDYTLMLRRVGGLFVTLAAGQVDARGNAEMRITLPTLAPGEYMVTFRGTHANGTGLKLTNYITVGPGGTYLVIEENQPGTW